MKNLLLLAALLALVFGCGNNGASNNGGTTYPYVDDKDYLGAQLSVLYGTWKAHFPFYSGRQYIDSVTVYMAFNKEAMTQTAYMDSTPEIVFVDVFKNWSMSMSMICVGG